MEMLKNAVEISVKMAHLCLQYIILLDTHAIFLGWVQLPPTEKPMPTYTCLEKNTVEKESFFSTYIRTSIGVPRGRLIMIKTVLRLDTVGSGLVVGIGISLIFMNTHPPERFFSDHRVLADFGSTTWPLLTLKKKVRIWINDSSIKGPLHHFLKSQTKIRKKNQQSWNQLIINWRMMVSKLWGFSKVFWLYHLLVRKWINFPSLAEDGSVALKNYFILLWCAHFSASVVIWHISIVHVTDASTAYHLVSSTL